MIGAAWQVSWWVPWTPVVAGIGVVWWLMRRAHHEEARRQAETERSLHAIRDELEARRRKTGWYQSQAYFDAECECIEIAERARAARSRKT